MADDAVQKLRDAFANDGFIADKTEFSCARNDRIKDELGVRLIYPTYRDGLAALMKTGED